MPDNQDFIIAGGGVVGAACAFELATAGRSVIVLEPDDRRGEAWRASAGMLAPQIDADPDNPLFELGIAGREYYRDKAAALRETGTDIDLYEGGILRLAVGAAEVERYKEAVAWQRQHGHRVEWLDLAEVHAEFPWVGPCDGALWAPHDGSVDPVKVVTAFRNGAEAAGARFESDRAVRLVTDGGRVVSVEGARARYSAGQVLLAAGAWSGRIEGLPRPLSVEPVRGQMLARPWPDNVPPGIVYGSGGYVLHRGGEALCGATMEHAGFDPEITSNGEREVAAATNLLVPALATLPTVRRWAGLRPGTPDGLPIFGREPRLANLWYATGYGRNGVLLAGITAVALGHLLEKEATFEGVAAMRPDRFWSW